MLGCAGCWWAGVFGWSAQLFHVFRLRSYAGWTQYTYRTTVDVRGLSSFYVAFGLSVTWETERTHYFDLSNVNIT